MEIERNGQSARLHFSEKALLKLLRRAPQAEAAAHRLAIYLDQSLETREPDPSGWWDYTDGRFDPSPPIELSPLGTPQARPSPTYFFVLGALWGLFAVGAWFSVHELYIQVGFTVLAVLYLAGGLAARRKQRRADQHSRRPL